MRYLHLSKTVFVMNREILDAELSTREVLKCMVSLSTLLLSQSDFRDVHKERYLGRSFDVNCGRL